MSQEIHHNESQESNEEDFQAPESKRVCQKELPLTKEELARKALKDYKITQSSITRLIMDGVSSDLQKEALLREAQQAHQHVSILKNYLKDKVLLFLGYNGRYGDWEETIILTKKAYDALIWYTEEYDSDFEFNLPESSFGKHSNVRVTLGDILLKILDDATRICKHFFEHDDDIWDGGLVYDYIFDYDMIKLYDEHKRQEGA